MELFFGIVAVVISVLFMVALIWKMRRSPASTGVTDATVEVRSSDAHRAVLSRNVGTMMWICGGIAVGSLAVLLGYGLYLQRSSPWMSVTDTITSFGGIGGIIALVFGGIGWWMVDALRDDIRAGIVLRTTGPVGVTDIQNAWVLDLADRSFGVSLKVSEAASSAEVVAVDHSRRAHTVFEMRDKDGTVVYRDKHYRPTL
jgi:hypothetical protein